MLQNCVSLSGGEAVTHYEFPTNERIRTLLRLEDIYDRAAFYAGREHALDHHTALLGIFEIMEVASRADLKSDLLSLNDEQYGIWYIDALENTDRYLDKTIEFVATVFTPKNFPEGYLKVQGLRLTWLTTRSGNFAVQRYRRGLQRSAPSPSTSSL